MRQYHQIGGPLIGRVVDRADPERLGRVRVCIPGVLEPSSPWARPIGTAWGGSARRGVFGVPVVGADVVVFFEAGDPEKPLYMGAGWGRPDDADELPEQATRSDEPTNQVIATETFRVEMDETPGARKLTISNVETGDNIVIDADRHTVMVAATTRLVLRAEGEVEIAAPVITIGGRAVKQPGGDL